MKHTRVKLTVFTLAVAIILAMVLTACGSEAGTQTNAPVSSSTSDSTLPASVTDVYGRTVELPEEINSTVCLGAGALRMVCYAQGEDKVIGVEEAEHEQTLAKAYNYLNYDKFKDLPIVAIATKAIMGHTIEEQGYSYGIVPEKETIAVKMPVFSFEKIKGAEISLGPEMKSTGEVLGISKNLDEAIYKAFMGTGIQLPKRKNIICTIKDSSKEEFLPIAKQYYMFGYDLYATEGTYKFLKEHDVPVHFVNRICEKTNTIFDLMFTDTVDLVIDIPTRNDNLKDGFLIRRFAVEAGIPIYTSLDTAKALIDSLEKRKQGVPSLIDITKLR